MCATFHCLLNESSRISSYISGYSSFYLQINSPFLRIPTPYWNPSILDAWSFSLLSVYSSPYFIYALSFSGYFYANYSQGTPSPELSSEIKLIHLLSLEVLKGTSNTCSKQNSGTFSLVMRTFSYFSRTHFPLLTAAIF